MEKAIPRYSRAPRKETEPVTLPSEVTSMLFLSEESHWNR
jgi:hypothetical protein